MFMNLNVVIVCFGGALKDLLCTSVFKCNKNSVGGLLNTSISVVRPFRLDIE